jgi:hypothetical protein
MKDTIYIFGKFLILFENQKHDNQITLYIIMGLYILKLHFIFIFLRFQLILNKWVQSQSNEPMVTRDSRSTILVVVIFIFS